MKKQLNPVVAIIVTLFAVAVIGGIIFFATQSTDGHRPTAAQASSGKAVGGKRLPGAVQISGGGDSSSSGSSGAQGSAGSQ